MALWGGKATTASEEPGQLGLFPETADSPRGAIAGADEDLTGSATSAVPKSGDTRRTIPTTTTMTMEEVADLGNLMLAFEGVKANDGAPGPDRQSIEEVEEQLEEILLNLRRTLLDESSTWAVHKGLGNAYFAALRLVSLEEQWAMLHAAFVAAPRQLRLALG